LARLKRDLLTKTYTRAADEQVSWLKSLPFIGVHVAAVVGVIYTGFGWHEAAWCFGLYFTRMFFIIGGYHRYFAHRSYKMGRVMQFLVALGGTTAAQKGPLWWAGHHRHHHKYSDGEEDIHSPKRGFWWSHVGWIVCSKYDETPTHLIKGFAVYPELRFLDRHWLLPPVGLAVLCLWLGGWGAVFGGFFVSTVLVFHGVFAVNSLTHCWGSRRYVTNDTSRNSMLISLLTLGEGWHNNHHYYQRSSTSGFRWWEIDMTYYILKILSWVGLVWGLHKPPKKVLESNLVADGHVDVGQA
jgi:stearoyl-CoA desaturase (Delta-9 desaturase)